MNLPPRQRLAAELLTIMETHQSTTAELASQLNIKHHHFIDILEGDALLSIAHLDELIKFYKLDNETGNRLQGLYYRVITRDSSDILHIDTEELEHEY